MTRQFSSGGVVYKKYNGSVLWLVTKSAPSEIYPDPVWRLPKGWIDNDTPDIPGPMASGRIKADEESLQKAGLREVAEEGGIYARIIVKIGTSKYFMNFPKGRVMKFVTFYLMEWMKNCPDSFDSETAETKWLPFGEAYKKLTYSNERGVLKKAQDLLASLA